MQALGRGRGSRQTVLYEILACPLLRQTFSSWAPRSLAVRRRTGLRPMAAGCACGVLLCAGAQKHRCVAHTGKLSLPADALHRRDLLNLLHGLFCCQRMLPGWHVAAYCPVVHSVSGIVSLCACALCALCTQGRLRPHMWCTAQVVVC